MKILTPASVLLLLTAYTSLPLVAANNLLLSRLQKSPAFLPNLLPDIKRIRLGTFLRKHPGQYQVNSRYLSPANNPSPNPGPENSYVRPTVNFTNMDGVLLNMLMRRLSR
ncbi:hypothetical protein BsWGS_01936 [Bradybaena similaris]